MTVSFSRKLVGLALGAAATIALPSAASAVSYNITSWGVDQSVSNSSDPMWGSITFKNASNNTVTENAWVGRLFLTGKNTATPNGPTQTLLTWCIDVFDNLQNGIFVQKDLYALKTQTPVYTEARLDKVVALMTHVNAGGTGLITSDSASAAAQLAIWEILNESSSTLDVTAGSFKASGGTLSSAVYTQANSWLGNLSTWQKVAGQDVIMINPNANNYALGGGNQAQIYVVAAAVPEPASWMTMILGFGAIGSAVRRRRTVGRAVA